jgi:hypothetical protein
MENIYFLTKDYMYEYKDGRVVKKELKKEKGIYTSIIYFKDIFNHTFKLPADLNKDELIIEAEKTVFNEATLDLTKEYKINYKFQKFDDYYLVDAFIAEVDRLKEEFSEIIKKFKYIDFIGGAPFVFEEYYNIANIIPKNDIFIFFTPKDAFLVGFKDKKFVFVKSLDKFSKLAAITNLKEDALITLLKEKGLNKTSYENDEFFNKIDSFFSQFFMKVNNLINYSKNFYHLDSIERIFFYSNIDINNLIENYSDFWNLSGIEFKKFELQSDYDPFEYCVTVYNAKNCLNENVNFSIFLRPPKFYKTKSGKFAVFSFIILMFLLSDGIYKYYLINNQQKQISRLQNLFHKKEKELKLVKLYIKKYKEKINKEKENIANIDTQTEDISSKISYLYYLKVKKPLFNEIADVVDFAVKHNLQIIKFEKNKSKINLMIKSNIDNSNLMAKFVKKLINLGYKNVFSDKITNKKNRYITVIKYNDE